MTPRFLTFCNDFKASAIYKAIVTDPKVEVLLIWVTGSTLTEVCDSKSDYDICVLCKSKPVLSGTFPELNIYNRPCSYFFVYKPENKKTQVVYNDINDIVSANNLLDNIGWAQFKNISTEYILYQNDKYAAFLDYLFQSKELLFQASAYLFVHSLLKYFHISTLPAIFQCCQTQPNKGLSHIGWLADSLQAKPLDKENLLKIKRTPVNELPTEAVTYLQNCILYLEQFIEGFNLDLQNLNMLLHRALEEVPT